MFVMVCLNIEGPQDAAEFDTGSKGGNFPGNEGGGETRSEKYQ
jgi:hypothetical protein